MLLIIEKNLLAAINKLNENYKRGPVEDEAQKLEINNNNNKVSKVYNQSLNVCMFYIFRPLIFNIKSTTMFILKIVKTFNVTFAAFTVLHLALSLTKPLQTAAYKIAANENIQKAFSATNVLVLLSIVFSVFIISESTEILDQMKQTQTSDNNIDGDIDEPINEDSSKDLATPIDPGEVELASSEVFVMSEIIHSQKMKNTLFCYYSKWNVTVEGLESKLNPFEKDQKEQLQFKLISCMILSPKRDKQSPLLIEPLNSEVNEKKDIGNPMQSQALTLIDLKAQLNAFNVHVRKLNSHNENVFEVD